MLRKLIGVVLERVVLVIAPYIIRSIGHMSTAFGRLLQTMAKNKFKKNPKIRRCNALIVPIAIYIFKTCTQITHKSRIIESLEIQYHFRGTKKRKAEE